MTILKSTKKTPIHGEVKFETKKKTYEINLLKIYNNWNLEELE